MVRMPKAGWFRGFVLALWACLLSACGGADSSTTTLSGPGLSGLVGPAVTLGTFTPKDNNMVVEVKQGPVAFNATPQANILYADVKVCEPANPANCVTVPHIQVDTGSVGLRVLASKLSTLNLPHTPVSAGYEAWQCYPFVIGGLWGRNVVANITLGTQVATSVPMQLIQDSTSGPQSTNDCNRASGGTSLSAGQYRDDAILKDAAMLGSNGILGIGATTLDCDAYCVAGNYSSLGFVMYYTCPQGAANNSSCAPTALGANQQVYNPVAALPQHNNGVVLALPAVPYPGASKVTGELIFGVNTSNTDPGAASNMLPGTVSAVALGTNPTHSASYLNITTTYQGQQISNSYLDTGTNGLFFTDHGLSLCTASSWYCTFSSSAKQAVLSDGDNPSAHSTPVSFQIDNAEVLFSTSNVAFAGLAGSPPKSGNTFAWGLPFFYGKRTYLTIWGQADAVSGPWYAWESLP